MSNVRIELITLACAFALAGCSGGEVTANDTVSAQPTRGTPEDLPPALSPARDAGLVIVASKRSANETVQRLRQAIDAKGMNIVAVVDHAADAQSAGLSLRPTTVVLFGNRALGTPLMQDRQTLGIDLPQRMLVYTDEAGKTWVAYNDPAWLAERHGVVAHDDALAKIAATLSELAKTAAN